MRVAIKGIYEVKQKHSKSRTTSACLTIINVTIILTSSIILFIQGKSCIERYVQANTKAIITEERTGDTTFIAFTICPDYGDAYDENVLHYFGSTVNQYRGGNFTLAKGVLNNYEAFNKVAYNLSEVVKSITISTADSSRPKVHVKIQAKSENAKLVTKYDSTFGKCFSLQIDPSVTALGITKIEFNTRLNIYIYLHHPGQYMDVDSKSKASGSLRSAYVSPNYVTLSVYVCYKIVDKTQRVCPLHIWTFF